MLSGFHRDLVTIILCQVDCVVDVLDSGILDILDHLWRKLGTTFPEVAAHAAYVLAQKLCVNVLRHQVRWILGTTHLA